MIRQNMVKLEIVGLIFIVLCFGSFALCRIVAFRFDGLVNSENNIMEVYMQSSNSKQYSYYISISNEGRLYYKIGLWENSNLMYSLKDGILTKDFIETSIAEKEVQLRKGDFRKVKKLLLIFEENNVSQKELHVSVLDGTLTYIWFNGKYYDVSPLLDVDKGFESYSKLRTFLFSFIENPTE